jgi:hypothetical protein
MGWTGHALAAASLAVAVMAPAAAAVGNEKESSTASAGAAIAAADLSAEARELAGWVLKSRDHKEHPFAIVDKKDARIYVFDGSGRLHGASPALLGQAPGDDIAPGVGAHTREGHVPFEERTTPAGRFVSEPGRNLTGEHVIWVDYDSAFAIHRLRPGRAQREREARLASPQASEHRASLGCVVVPVQFYEQVVQRMLGNGRAIVYVMPENGSAREMFSAMGAL